MESPELLVSLETRQSVGDVVSSSGLLEGYVVEVERLAGRQDPGGHTGQDAGVQTSREEDSGRCCGAIGLGEVEAVLAEARLVRDPDQDGLGQDVTETRHQPGDVGVQQELGERGVRLETFLPPGLVMEKYREVRERGADNTTVSVNLSREELLMLVQQASKTEEKSN